VNNTGSITGTTTTTVIFYYYYFDGRWCIQRRTVG
jgi:hypothetical protein